MIHALNSKILLSGAVILAASAVVIGATFAFFSDTETSAGNTFTAGQIDLQIDNESYVTNNSGALVASPGNSWSLTNLSNQLFFSFADVKPGDIGEDTISIHVENNDAWVCMAADLTQTPDNGIVEPETEAGDITDGANGGELQNFLNFSFWKDDGDNVYETGESILTSLTGPASGLFNGTWQAIADSANGPAITGATTAYVGKAWCFGALTPVGVAQDAAGKLPGSTNGPLVRGTGFTCNGVGEQNIAQTDGIVVDVSFQAVQSRSNGQFTCGSLPPFVGQTPVEPVVIDDVNDLDPGPAATAATNNSGKWFMYNDTTDVIDNTLGSFVAGPSTPPNGGGSIEFTLGAGPQDRKNIATFQFSGMALSSISQMSMGVYSHGGTGGAGPNESPFLAFNVDFTGSSGAFQSRLVYVPSTNGSVPQDSWNTHNLISGGAAKWVYSGANWPAPNAQPGTTFKTWAQILADYPSARLLPVGGWLGIRVGEPGPSVYIGNVDFFSLNSTVYDFGN